MRREAFIHKTLIFLECIREMQLLSNILLYFIIIFYLLQYFMDEKYEANYLLTHTVCNQKIILMKSFVY